MNTYFDEVPTSASLLLQCGYRSKVCTNHRATKLDGTLHKLCEFHRRKANLNQQRLHKRQRQKRAAAQLYEPHKTLAPAEDLPIKQEFAFGEEYPVKKARLSMEPIVDPRCYNFTNFGEYDKSLQHTTTNTIYCASEFALRSVDVDILELLLADMQSLPPSTDHKDSIIV